MKEKYLLSKKFNSPHYLKRGVRRKKSFQAQEKPVDEYSPVKVLNGPMTMFQLVVA